MKDINKVVILGSGGLKIGQAGEFDYSGSQAIKAMQEENVETILINPNIATVQTDPEMVDTLYLEPLVVERVKKIIAKEEPDGILLGFGGQTALNLGIELKKEGILQEHNVEILGTSIDSIERAENRKKFKEALKEIGVDAISTSKKAETITEAISAAEEIGYPVILRSGFTLGGLGSGKITDQQELKQAASGALSKTDHILIEEYLQGWKEVEYEIVRDSENNTIVACNMENMDPMGVHTGESIVVTPSQTLNNQQYHKLREISIEITQHFEIVGECNIQFSINPDTGEYRVIEMNPRLSRSSALASKATGYPLAYVAAKLALDLPLYDIKNNVTKETTAFFEPALDYVAVKIPRWDTNKIIGAEREISSEMKSVGEVMAIDRNFSAALQKAVRMLNIGSEGLSDSPFDFDNLTKSLKNPTDKRIFALYKFLKNNSIQQAYQLTNIDPWYLKQIKKIIQKKENLIQEYNENTLEEAKKIGLSDQTIADVCGSTSEKIRIQRKEMNITPKIKQIDTLAGEFPAKTNYLYLSYNADYHDIEPMQQEGIIILGSGTYRIGSSVEFDWAAVNSAWAAEEEGMDVAMINYNPETVSTDYDESDRLYFEELTEERVKDIAEFEQNKGIVVSVGGQQSNTLAPKLKENGFNVLGTDPDNIRNAENRARFSTLLDDNNIRQPDWIEATSKQDVIKFINQVDYPVLVRPSFVLSGAAMSIVNNKQELDEVLNQAQKIADEYPVVVSNFISNATEIEFDAVAQQGEIVLSAISEHIESAGVHSGDSTLITPPQQLNQATQQKIKQTAATIAQELKISGPFNIQFLKTEQSLMVIECNLRTSRSFPFVSKTFGKNFIKTATKILLGQKVDRKENITNVDHVGVKSPQFSYNRLGGSDSNKHVEMASTGEVGCLGKDFLGALYLSWISADNNIENKTILLDIEYSNQPEDLLKLIQQLDQEWNIITTKATAEMANNYNIDLDQVISKQSKQEKLEQIIKQIGLVISIPKSMQPKAEMSTDSAKLRRLTIDNFTPILTNQKLTNKILYALIKKDLTKIPALSWSQIVN